MTVVSDDDDDYGINGDDDAVKFGCNSHDEHNDSGGDTRLL